MGDDVETCAEGERPLHPWHCIRVLCFVDVRFLSEPDSDARPQFKGVVSQLIMSVDQL
jgi:hypothetical protein